MWGLKTDIWFDHQETCSQAAISLTVMKVLTKWMDGVVYSAIQQRKKHLKRPPTMSRACSCTHFTSLRPSYVWSSRSKMCHRTNVSTMYLVQIQLVMKIPIHLRAAVRATVAVRIILDWISLLLLLCVQHRVKRQQTVHTARTHYHVDQRIAEHLKKYYSRSSRSRRIRFIFTCLHLIIFVYFKQFILLYLRSYSCL